MKERPILFSAPMVRAILDGTKTQTRRILKHGGEDFAQYETVSLYEKPENVLQVALRCDGYTYSFPCPYGKPGDRLWVRETWGTIKAYDHKAPRDLIPSESNIGFATDDISRWCQTGCNGAAGRWRPSIHMPRWASRITLEITDVRVEHLGDISVEDARAEGYPRERAERNGDSKIDPWLWYRMTWEEINGARSWAKNPWVWVINFKVM